MTTVELGTGSNTEPSVVIVESLGKCTVIDDPDGERYGGKSQDLRRKSVVPESASVLMTALFCCELGEEEVVLKRLCLVLLHTGKANS